MFVGVLLVNTFFAMVTAWLIFYFIKSTFVINITQSKLICFIFSFGILNGSVSSLWTKYINFSQSIQLIKPILLLVLSVVLIKFLLKAEWLQVILSFCFISLIMGISNFLVPTIIKVTVEDTQTDFKTFLLVNILINLLTTLIVVFTPYIKNIGKAKNLNPIAFLLLLTFVIMALNFGVHYVSSFNPITFTAALISSLAYFLSTLIYISRFSKYELKMEEQKQQAFYNESLSTSLQDLRRFKHDQNNHLSVIEGMLRMGKSQEAYSYLQEITSSSDNNINTAIFNLRNAGLFSIISSKMDRAKKCEVDFKLNTIGVIDSIDNIKISDLCEIIGIYLDNAIEAASESDMKQVEVLVISSDTSIDITIKNSCKQSPVMHKIKIDGYSSKTGTDRGHGLSIVDKILQKYKNVLNNINFDENAMQFVQMLKIEKGS
ncbi:sensor histidine kinase [Ruminiclostridium josui]|uniref:sensor histidine kinase n=1 Tax=Ruminiclostridium josui TaxID=1499 RepID=UPI0004671F43|nr:GHKL domain-containing protein [Ruminiclostridium josui]